MTVDVCWPHLKTLCTDDVDEIVLSNIADAVEKKLFPSLLNVCITSTINLPSLQKFEAFRRLAKVKIFCHQSVAVVDSFAQPKCVCQFQNVFRE